MGQCVYKGRILYVECWENKPPGLFWLNALGYFIGRGSPFPAWIMPGVMGLMGVMIMALALRRTLGLAATCWSALLASAVLTIRGYDSPSINPDFYAAVFGLPAAALWLSALDRGRIRSVWWRGLLAGLFLAAATLIKQTGALGFLAVSLVALIVVILRHDAHQWVGVTLLVWLGFLLGLGAAAFVVYQAGTLRIAFDSVFRFNTGLLEVGRITGLIHDWPRLSQWCAPIVLPLWLAFVGLLAAPNRRESRVPLFALIALSVWWLIEWCFAMLGPSGSMRYMQGTFAPMLVLAAVGLSHVFQSLNALSLGLRVAPVLAVWTVALLLAKPMYDTYATGLAGSHLAFGREPTERDRLHEIAIRIIELVPQEDDAIYVWNYDSGVYVHADRPCASAYTHPRSAQQMQEIMTCLQEGKAKVVLVPEKGSHHFDLWCDEACRYELAGILSQFERQSSGFGYDWWVWRGSQGPEKGRP